MTRKHQDPDAERPSAAFRVGAIALVFLIIGYQIALFMYRASALAVVAHRDKPDTVYVVDRALAEEILSGASPILPVDSGHGVASSATPVPDRAFRSGSRTDPGRTAEDAVRIRRDAPHGEEAGRVREHFARRRAESFPFDPNTASEEEFKRLGFSEKQAQALIRYREKGGRFRRKEDFARSFVVADSVYARLAPYIRIPRLDLNTADSAAFDALPGIGPFYAGRMLSYRRELGGYSYPEQLMDIWKFDREKYDALADLVTVRHPYRYPLWTLPEDSLKRHPYLDVHAAHGIVLFRSATAPDEWTVDNLVKAGILKPAAAAKLAPCLAPPRQDLSGKGQGPTREAGKNPSGNAP